MANKSSQRAKIHHFLPQTLQRPFRNDEGKIWYSESDNEGKFCKPELRNTSSTFKIRDYYTTVENGVLSDKIETEFYGVLDDFLANFLTEVHEVLNNGKTPDVSGGALSSIRKVLYHLIIRTPDFVKKYDDTTIGKEVIEATISDAEEAGLQDEKVAVLKADLTDSTKVRNLGRSVRAQGQASQSILVEEALKDFDVRFAVSRGKHSFILASQCAYRIGNGGHNGLNNPKMEIWMPISPKRALVLVRDKAKKIPMIVDEPRDHVRSVNEFAVRNAKQIASHSDTLLRSLLC